MAEPPENNNKPGWHSDVRYKLSIQ